VHVDHSKRNPTEDKLSVKGVWSLSRDLFKKNKLQYLENGKDSFIVSIKFE